MKFKVKALNLMASEPQILLHDEDCVVLGVKDNDRVTIIGKRTTIALVAHTNQTIEPGTAYIPVQLLKQAGAQDGDTVDIAYTHNPDSTRFIRKKMDGKELTKEQIEAIVRDILDNRLS